MNNEEWRDIYGYGDLYMVSESGKIKRKPIKYKGVAGGRPIVKTKGEYFPSIRTHPKGYLYVSLCIPDKGKADTRIVHRLVAEAFLDSYSNELTVDHVDCDKLNNHYSNLEMVTNAENLRRSHSYGTHSHFIPKPKLRKLSHKQVLEIRDLYSCNDKPKSAGYYKRNYSQRKLAKMFNVSQNTIGQVVNLIGVYKDVRL